MTKNAEPAPSRGSRLLREWRAARGLLQRQAAAELDLDPARYSDMENGKILPRLTRAGEIEKRTDGAVPLSSWLEPDSDAAEARAS